MAHYATFATEIDYETKREEIKKRIKRAEKAYLYYQKVSVVLEKFDGKKLTKREIDKIKKETGYDVYLENPSSNLYYLVTGFEEERHRLFLGYDKIFNNEKFQKDYSVPFQNDKPYTEGLKEGLKKLRGLVNRYNKLLEKQRELVKDAKELNMEFDFDILAVER